jgi:NSS family neurotransmitter:Na+ symporter
MTSKQTAMHALGQSFFSMSLGVGAMMAYGSYLSKKENLPAVALQVCLLDTGIAFLAGLLVIPCMFVALHNGMVIYDANGLLESNDILVFTVLPAFFASLGSLGTLLSILFFKRDSGIQQADLQCHSGQVFFFAEIGTVSHHCTDAEGH